jgi:hypothetical protein
MRMVTMVTFVTNVTNVSTVTTSNDKEQKHQKCYVPWDGGYLICQIYRRGLNIKELLRGSSLTVRTPARLALGLARSQQTNGLEYRVIKKSLHVMITVQKHTKGFKQFQSLTMIM